MSNKEQRLQAKDEIERRISGIKREEKATRPFGSDTMADIEKFLRVKTLKKKKEKRKKKYFKDHPSH